MTEIIHPRLGQQGASIANVVRRLAALDRGQDRLEQRAGIVHERDEEVPMGFLALAHRLLDLGFEVAPRLDVDMDVGDAAQSLQV